MFDDLDLQTANRRPKPLDALSIDELTAYVAELQAEILRVEAAIKTKSAHMAAAAGLFKGLS